MTLPIAIGVTVPKGPLSRQNCVQYGEQVHGAPYTHTNIYIYRYMFLCLYVKIMYS